MHLNNVNFSAHVMQKYSQEQKKKKLLHESATMEKKTKALNLRIASLLAKRKQLVEEK